MSTNCVMGYCKGLYDALQAAGYDEVPYKVYDHCLAADELELDDLERQEVIDHLLLALIGLEEIDPDFTGYLERLWNSIDNEMLSRMISAGEVIRLLVNERGYFLAVK